MVIFGLRRRCARYLPYRRYIWFRQPGRRIRVKPGNPFLASSSYECRKEGTSYSVETLVHFRKRFTGAELYFVIGWDAWCEIGSWYSFPEFFSLANFIVISRHGLGSEPADSVDSVGPLFPFALKDEFCYERDACYRHISGHTLNFMAVTRLDISSSQVRGETAAGRSLRYLVPDGVAKYIYQHRLYI